MDSPRKTTAVLWDWAVPGRVLDRSVVDTRPPTLLPGRSAPSLSYWEVRDVYEDRVRDTGCEDASIRASGDPCALYIQDTGSRVSFGTGVRSDLGVRTPDSDPKGGAPHPKQGSTLTPPQESLSIPPTKLNRRNNFSHSTGNASHV